MRCDEIAFMTTKEKRDDLHFAYRRADEHFRLVLEMTINERLTA